MNPEDKKRAAELVTGRAHIVAGYSVLCAKPGWRDLAYFDPDFEGVPGQRSQALAVVEWLVDNGKRLAYCTRAFKARDIDGLMQMVLELSDDR